MDIPLVLEQLRPGDDWGPCAQSDSTYAELSKHWRGRSTIPTESEMLETWDLIKDRRSATDDARDTLKTIGAKALADITQDDLKRAVKAWATLN